MCTKAHQTSVLELVLETISTGCCLGEVEREQKEELEENKRWVQEGYCSGSFKESYIFFRIMNKLSIDNKDQ